jgi:phosphoribosylamine---glycine ligase
MADAVIIQDKSARNAALAQALQGSAEKPEIYAASDVNNPRLVPPDHFFLGKTDDPKFISHCITKIKPKPALAIIGPEEPLKAGIANLYWDAGIPCVGPLQELAKIETSKAFAREIMTKYGIQGCPEYRIFKSPTGIEKYLRKLRDFVIKPDGLTGGKGVKVSGEHLHSIAEALAYCEELFKSEHAAIVVEEKLDGEEFSFQSFCDGQNIVHTIPIQDHKRAWDGDKGPNTGGMGSYSCENHLLPFLNSEHVRKAGEINLMVAEALRKETGLAYKGVLYGGFMLTGKGLRVIEYNARFGDPEIMNVLPLLQTDFFELCKAITAGKLDRLKVTFAAKATVCKYIVPQGYPAKPMRSMIDVSELDRLEATEPNLKVYYGAVESCDDGLALTGSRAIGIVGIGDTLEQAERIAERAASSVKGDVYHRKDIGTEALIQKRMNHIARICSDSKRVPDGAPSARAAFVGGRL